jgi:dihydrodipicolinate synthase/N-acetylneuraminate lyase
MNEELEVSNNAAINGLAASQRIRGVLAPVVTPFKTDLAPDSQRFIAHCKWLLSQNCGLAVFGTNSEANSLSMEERAMLLDELVAAGVDPARMMPGTGCCSITVSVVDRQFRANAAIVSFFDIDLKFFRAES